MDPNRRVGEPIALHWYDGPLVEILRLQRNHCPIMVEIRSRLCKIQGEEPWKEVSLCLTREELIKMVDLIDGKPVEDCHGDLYSAEGEKIDMDIAIKAAEDADAEGYATVKT